MFGSGFAVAVGVFGWLGHLWDERTGRAPLGVLLGVGLGFVYGGYELWKLVRMSERENPTGGEGKSTSPKQPERDPPA